MRTSSGDRGEIDGRIFELLSASKKELELGLYDRAVGSAYLAVRMAIEVFLNRKRVYIPRTDAELIDELRNLTERKIWRAAVRLMVYNVQASYVGADELMARKALELAEDIIETVYRR